MCYSLNDRTKKESVVWLTNLTNETRLVNLKNENATAILFGTQDKHLTLLEESMEVIINSRGSHLEIIGSEENTAIVEEILNQLEELIKRSIQIGPSDVVTAIKMAKRIHCSFSSACMKKKLGKIMAANQYEQKHLANVNIFNPLKKMILLLVLAQLGQVKLI